MIGGGQAGLAVAYCLQQLGRSALVLDAEVRPGDTWRKRYESLVLFTPSQYCGLPGMPFPAPRDTYPTKDEVAAYLEQYVVDKRLDVRNSCEVESLTLHPSGGRFEIAGAFGSMTAQHVVVATGAFRDPYLPPFAGRLDSSVVQLHSNAYRNPSSVSGRRVAVVGLGNSGAQIAEELCDDHEVTIVTERRPKRIPQRWLGRDIFWWFERAGMIDRVDRVSPRAGRRPSSARLIGTRVPHLLRRGRLALAPRVVGATGDSLELEGGELLTADTVIWATGYRNCYPWLKVPPVLGATGQPQHQQGISSVPGLYFLGVGHLSRKSSMFLGFVGRDAQRLAVAISSS